MWHECSSACNVRPAQSLNSNRRSNPTASPKTQHKHKPELLQPSDPAKIMPEPQCHNADLVM